MRVELLTNAQFNQIIRSGSFRCVDVLARQVYNISFAGARNDHYDVTHTTSNDATIAERILGRVDLDVWRARSVVIIVGNRFVAMGLCQFMHAARMGGANPGAKYPSLSNTRPPTGWARGGHECGYVSNSVGGAGNAPNAAMSAESNAFARQVQNGERGGQARAACYEAFLRGNAPDFLAYLATVVGGTAPTTPTTPTPQQPTSPPTSTTVYTVVAGDTLSAIAVRHGVTVSAILAINPNITDPNRINIGQRINIPSQARSHVVTSGQTLTQIANMYRTTINAIMARNPSITNANNIRIGQIIIIP